MAERVMDNDVKAYVGIISGWHDSERLTAE
jgi:hypothetical protein